MTVLLVPMTMFVSALLAPVVSVLLFPTMMLSEILPLPVVEIALVEPIMVTRTPPPKRLVVKRVLLQPISVDS